MGSPLSGKTRKRGTLPKTFRPGVIAKPKGDRRRAEIRDASNLLQQAHADLGGVDELPVTVLAAAERWAFTVMQVRRMEAEAHAGRPLDAVRYVALTQVMLKLSDRLGYTRRQKRITLADVIREHALEAQNTPPAGPPAARQVHTDAATPDGAGHQTEDKPI